MADGDHAPVLSASSRREREFLRYAEAVIGLEESTQDRRVISAKDKALSAYAQLVCLRLNAKRAFISLFDKKRQYIIAEATQTLSLQQDEVHAETDAMWFGAGVMPREEGDFNTQTLNSYKKRSGDAPGFFAVRDLREDERFSQHSLVLNAPYGRGYAGVTLNTPNGYAIGTLSFLDDKARDIDATSAEIKFMHDIATTVVSHLEMARKNLVYARGLRMVRGLSRFVEGKNSVDEPDDRLHESLDQMQHRQTQQAANLGASQRTHALNAAGNKERWNDARDERHDQLNWESSGPNAATISRQGQSSLAMSEPFPNTEQERRSADAHNAPPAAPGLENHVAESGIQEDLLSDGVRRSIQRAAVIINQALATSGVLFLDASVGEFGNLRNTEHSVSSAEDSGESSNSTGSEKENDNSSIHAQEERDEEPDSVPQKPCRQLGSAYDQRTFIDSKSGVLHRGIPEKFLKSIMRRNPYGRIWHFDDEGNSSSEESSESGSAAEYNSAKTGLAITSKASQTSRARKRRSRQRDAQIIQGLFPGVRAIMLMPMWDSSRQRFFAGAIAWSYSPLRVLTFHEDLTFLGAFCDVIMAEIGRLDAQSEAKAKESFISSISHELKSPLHGILGGVECLQDKDNVSSHEDILQMIDASGRSLLDIINHLLEHAHVMSKGAGSPKVKAKRYSHGAKPRSTNRIHVPPQSVHNLAFLTEDLLETAVWSFPSSPAKSAEKEKPSSIRLRNHDRAPVQVSLEVHPNLTDTDWNFQVNAGGWKRIVQNLTSNSMKYTDPGGYVKVSLSAGPHDADGSGATFVRLECRDSGRGMSQDYLDHGLWQAFSQEDPHASGTGLGLSLVHSIVKDMRGIIKVQSSKGVGTTVRVSVPLIPGWPSGLPPGPPMDAATRKRLANSTFALLGFEESEAEEERATHAVIKNSILENVKSNGLRLTSEMADIYILPDAKAVSIAKNGPSSDKEADAIAKPTIVLCHSIVSSREFTVPEMGFVTTLTPPFGPRKLLQALSACLENLASSQRTKPRIEPSSGSTQTSSASSPTIDARRYDHTNNASTTEPNGTMNDVSSESRTQLTVLLVDDNKMNLTLLLALMKKVGHYHISATNGQEAVNAYRDAHDQVAGSAQPPPAVILMDITMPVMDGLEATRHIRAMERARRIVPPSKIIALTAAESPEARHEAFSSGMDLFLTKPVRLKELTSILDEHLETMEKTPGNSFESSDIPAR